MASWGNTMRRHQYSLMLTLVIFCFIAQAVFIPAVLAQKKNTKDLTESIKKLEDKISEIRRDQLNYRIERDLLKETFSSNFQTINLLLAIILGVFTIINFLGFRDIGSIKKEYMAELRKLDGIRVEFEEKIKHLIEEQEKTKKQYEQIDKTDKEQSDRIKILEVQEKVSSLIQNRNFARALEYAITALEISPGNNILLRQKAHCYLKMGEFSRSTEVYEQILKGESDDLIAITNLLELYLILNRLPEYRSLYNEKKTLIQTKEDWPFLETYFCILENYQSNNYPEMLRTIIAFSERLTGDKIPKTKWGFEEIEKFLTNVPSDKKKSLLQIFIKLITGVIKIEEFKNELAKIGAE